MKINDLKLKIEIPFLYFFYKKLILFIWSSINHHPTQFLIYSGDIIGLGPQFFNSHEPHMVGAIQELADYQYSHFFLDIGANIGLISCLVHSHFNLIEAIEPNPDCIYLLKKNFEMSLINNYKINEFALDDFDEEGSLMIPKKNMGGAFKAGVNNSYTEMQLAAKDGFKLFNQDNYRVVNIRTRASEEYFRNFFTRMAHADKKLGIIKIDVEGMELSIIRRIGATIPMDFGVIIFFEHLSNSIDRDKLLCEFKGRKVSLYSLDKYYKNFNYFKRLIHFTLCLIKNRVKYSLVEIKKDVIYSNDLVLKIE